MVAGAYLPHPIVDGVQVMDVEGRVRPLIPRKLGREQLHPGVVADEGQPPACKETDTLMVPIKYLAVSMPLFTWHLRSLLLAVAIHTLCS